MINEVVYVLRELVPWALREPIKRKGDLIKDDNN